MYPEETDAPQTSSVTNSVANSESPSETPAVDDTVDTLPEQPKTEQPKVEPVAEAAPVAAVNEMTAEPVPEIKVEQKVEAKPEVASTPEVVPPSVKEDEKVTAPERPRVRLNPTMPSATVANETSADKTATEEAVAKVDEELKAVPSIQGLGDAPKNSPAVEVPDVLELDAAMEAELNEAMTDAAAKPKEKVEIVAAAGDESTGENDEAPATPGELEEGARIKATVQSIAGEDIFFEIAGERSPGMVSLRQFKDAKPPEVGTVLDVIISKIDEAEGLINLNLPHGRAKVGGDWSAVAVGQIVDCMVTKTNKGGLEVNVSNLRGFLPISQVDTDFVADLEPYVGQKLTVQVMEVKPAKRNLVVSRRAFLELGRAEEAEKLWETIELGQQFPGVVKTIKDYGAFVNIGSADGFLHISEIAWNRINHPSDVLTIGQQVEVQVVKLDQEKKRIGLGMKQLAANPWSTAEANYSKGTTVSGKVTRVADFGAFIQLEPGVEGLVHISELDHQRVHRVADVLKEEQEVEVQVLEVDMGRKRISLSLKALKEKPVVEKKESAEESASPKIQRPKNAPPLKGGNSEQKSNGGLFGNPSDFGK
ncbi:SSU ribosomal protein S1p [hydrothermal vent metagenome]|uniref:SSU ribosomal protein S1p n=1 Tax=hydrothermal vent metagenome TaxID=652676 RepID=A0A3B1DIE3_9ZZZZ